MGYDVGLICLNGHVINSLSLQHPESNSPFCKECGEKAINACENCNTPIRGFDLDSGCCGLEVPKHCHNCGNPYPWTQRKIDALIDAIGMLDELNQNETNQLKDLIPDIIAETPKTRNAVARFNKAITKSGKVSGKVLYDTIISIAANVVANNLTPK